VEDDGYEAGDLVAAMGGRASANVARRLLGDQRLRRLLAATWSADPPSLPTVVVALVEAERGNPGPRRLLEELSGSPLLGALERWARRGGSPGWFAGPPAPVRRPARLRHCAELVGAEAVVVLAVDDGVEVVGPLTFTAGDGDAVLTLPAAAAGRLVEVYTSR
jgi:hypothetical protein